MALTTEIRPSFPLGEAKKLNCLERDERNKYLVLFSSVRNNVAEVNPNIQIPFKFTVGEPSSLGIFAYSTLAQSEPSILLPNSRLLVCWPMHQRSALLGRVVFSDNLGKTFYRDIDLKGIGWIASECQGDLSTAINQVRSFAYEFDRGDYFGLLDLATAHSEQQRGEEFASAGIRTHRVLAVIELEELILEGRKISVTEARNQYLFPKNFQPAVVVRAFGTKARVKDISLRSGKSEQYRRLLIEDAKKMVSQEFHTNLTSDEEYLRWFAKMLGVNVRLMHKTLGVAHNVLTEHNITLDCRVTDHAGVTPLEDNGRKGDLERSKITLRNLTEYVGKAFGTVHEEMEAYMEMFKRQGEFWLSRELIAIFEQSYQKTLP